MENTRYCLLAWIIAVATLFTLAATLGGGAYLCGTYCYTKPNSGQCIFGGFLMLGAIVLVASGMYLDQRLCFCYSGLEDDVEKDVDDIEFYRARRPAVFPIPESH
ncbi:unnamed protein product [Dibothriocephalus latus]|uniref:Uncharacterized protein n=1 Tax=Dibothriocephalus latus TaxID=60516 RepID=A0A3P7L490_DIBLA|nr:unnamed protein product [Dibothriocephalus latus]